MEVVMLTGVTVGIAGLFLLVLLRAAMAVYEAIAGLVGMSTL